MTTRDPGPPLSEERVAAYVRGELSPAERAEVEAAIDRDPEWLAVVALLARRSGSADDACSSEQDPSVDGDASLVEQIEREHIARLRPGARLGRYEVEGPLGRGGMGMVYAAYDPELDRRVALKLLRGRDPRGQERLLREARALARLSDRHVITIHDVGTFEGRVFLAMELLDGQTLQAWRASAPRTWREVLAVFVDAGRGLAAAHAAGLVHRDFKPANVMLTTDGRVVVLDFGLAHMETETESVLDDAPTELPLASDHRHTRTAQVLGTPAYMAPEQRRGEPCGPRADQFSFCVALFEALHGGLPSQTHRIDATPGHASAAGRLPRRVDSLLARGLALDPEARHASLEALVDALAAELHPRSRKVFVAFSLASIVAAAAWVARDDTPVPCTGATEALATTWNDARAAAVAEALASNGRPWSRRVRDEVDRRLHAYADAWVVEHEATCRATRVDGMQSEAVLDLRMRCLDRRRRSLHALVDVLAVPDVETATHAVQAADALPSLAGCRDVEALSAPVPVPEEPEQRAHAEALFDRIARVEALRQATQYADADLLASETVQQAVALGHPPTEADARLAAGWVHTDRDELEAAEIELRAALHAAEQGRHDEAVTIAWNRLAWVVGYKLARHDEGRRLAEHAEAWNRRLGPAPYHELARLRSLGWIEHDAGAPKLALEHFDEALAVAEALPEDDPVRLHELSLVYNGLGAAALALADLPRAEQSFALAGQQLEAQLGPDHPDVARVRNNLASLLRDQGKADEARRVFEQNLVVFEGTFDDAHPLVGQTLINLAVTELDLGRHLDAERHAERAIAVLTASHGPEHLMVAKAHAIRGDARVQLHRPAEAIEDFELARTLEVATLGEEHPSVAIIETNLGAAHYDMGRHDAAADHHERALEILQASLGHEHPNVAFVVMSLGLTRRAQGRRDEALALFRRAEAHAGDTVRPNALTRIGEILLDQGHVKSAIEHLDRAVVLQAELELDPGFTGDTRFALARARWAAGDHQAAHAEAQAAIEAYVAGGDTEPEAEARHWITEHEVRPER